MDHDSPGHYFMKPVLHKLNFKTTGKIHQGYDPFTGKAFKMVYQRVRKGLGNLEDHGRMGLQLRIEPPRNDKKSTQQLQCRARLRAATAAWQALDEDQKKVFRHYAIDKHMTGFNLCVSNYCQQHPLNEFQ